MALIHPCQFDRRIFGCAVSLVATLLLAGCSANEGSLRLVSVNQKHLFSQKFSQAYITRNSSGDADIVLVEDNFQAMHQEVSRPQHPDPCVMPRELVHIRVFWTPMSGVKADHPANTNASIHWCFICDSASQAGVVEYSGSGLVEVSDAKDGASITIRKAWMKQACQRGQMVDPIGPSILDGSFRALHDQGEVQSIISEIKSASSSTAEAQAGGVNPEN